MFDLGQKLYFIKFSTLIFGSSLIGINFLSQMSTFLRKLESPLEV